MFSLKCQMFVLKFNPTITNHLNGPEKFGDSLGYKGIFEKKNKLVQCYDGQDYSHLQTVQHIFGHKVRISQWQQLQNRFFEKSVIGLVSHLTLTIFQWLIYNSNSIRLLPNNKIHHQFTFLRDDIFNAIMTMFTWFSKHGIHGSHTISRYIILSRSDFLLDKYQASALLSQTN